MDRWDGNVKAETVVAEAQQMATIQERLAVVILMVEQKLNCCCFFTLVLL